MRLNPVGRVFLGVLCLVFSAAMGSADRPRVYCIDGATVVPAPGERLEDATVIIRDGLIEAITLAPARILGVGHDLGSIEAGKSASLVITDGDVLEIRTSIERVFIDGREASLETHQTLLYERYISRPVVDD